MSRAPCTARFAVSIVGQKGNTPRMIHFLDIVDVVDAVVADDACAHAARKFEAANPDFDVIGLLCEEIRHG